MRDKKVTTVSHDSSIIPTCSIVSKFIYMQQQRTKLKASSDSILFRKWLSTEGPNKFSFHFKMYFNPSQGRLF